MTLTIRKIYTVTEEILVEGNKAAESPVHATAVAVVLTNPWAGAFVEDLRPFIYEHAPVLGKLMTDRLTSIMKPADIEAYGKCAAVGLDGEIEHGSALIHTLRFGNMFREAAQGTTYLSFTNTRNTAGSLLSLPMTHKTVTGTRSHFLTLNFQVPDAPRNNEILIAIGASNGGRPHARIGDRFQDMKEMGIDQP